MPIRNRAITVQSSSRADIEPVEIIVRDSPNTNRVLNFTVLEAIAIREGIDIWLDETRLARRGTAKP